MIIERRTVGAPVELGGDGLHSGVPVDVRLMPGEHGIRFRSGGDWVQAVPDNVTDTSRCTRLGEISTIEHLMSALCGLEITDVDVELTAPEMPALDGSALQYCELIEQSGTASLPAREGKDVFTRVFLQEEGVKIAISAGEGLWRYHFQTGERWPHEQVYEGQVLDGYAQQIAPARTFGFIEELPHLAAMGLAKGLNLETALVIGETDYQNASLFEDEPVRHKMLDLMGDLYLAGVPARFLNVVAERSGHRTNVQAARLLWQALAG